MKKEDTMENEDKKNEDQQGGIEELAETTMPDYSSITVNHQDNDVLDEIDSAIAQQVQEELSNLEPIEIPIPEKKKPKRKFFKVMMGVLGAIVLATMIFVATPWGRNQVKKFIIYCATEYAYSRMDYDAGGDVAVQDPTEDIDSTDMEAKKSLDIIWGNSGYDGYGRHEDYVVNILLLGEEAIGSGVARGRTDMMMIATMNLREKSVKLTSLMRDMLVQIPEFNGKTYLPNKLNSAYEIGGIQLLYETIAKNFDVALDGYALVGFEDFERIIDAVGGVDVTLSEKEARYLNTTNYISNPSNRKLIAGTQRLNGNQALGFCRVRHVATVDDQHYDYGRTSRQRVVLNAIFDQCMDMSMTQLIFMMNDLLQYVTTDITKEQFRNYLEIGLSLQVSDVQNCRIPVDGAYEEGYERGMAVLIPDLDANIKTLHSFVFGDVLEEGHNDGIVLDGLDHLNAIEENQKEQLQSSESINLGESNHE